MYPVGVLFGMGFDTASEMYVALSLVLPFSLLLMAFLAYTALSLESQRSLPVAIK